MTAQKPRKVATLLAEIVTPKSQGIDPDLSDKFETLNTRLRGSSDVRALLTSSEEHRGWLRPDITSTEFEWPRQLMPATGGRMLDTRDGEGRIVSKWFVLVLPPFAGPG